MDNIPAGAIPVDQSQSPPPGAIPVDQVDPTDVESIPETTSQEQVPPDAVPADSPDIDISQIQDTSQPLPTQQSDDYTQQTLAGLEGAGRGIAGPVATLAEEKLLGVTPEDIEARKQQYPITAGSAEAATMLGSMFTGVGEAGLIAKALPEIEAVSNAGKFGAMALRGAVEQMALRGGEEWNKKLLGETDPNETTAGVLANIGAAGLFGAATGGALAIPNITSGTGFQALQDSKMASRASGWIKGWGMASKGFDEGQVQDLIDSGLMEGNPKTILAGIKHYNDFTKNMIDTATEQTTGVAAGAVGTKVGALAAPVLGAPGAIYGYQIGKKIAKLYLDPLAEKILQKPITKFSENFALPLITKVLTSDQPLSVPSALSYAEKASKGITKIDKAMQDLFQAGSKSVVDYGINETKKARLKDTIDSGYMDNPASFPQSGDQNYAAGGPVITNTDPFAKAMPQENMLLQAAKMRVYGHLKTLKPQSSIGMAFDDNKPTKEAKKTYDKALDLAVNPMRVLYHVKKGDITSEHIVHMNAMYPELMEHMRKEATKYIYKAQLSGEKPSYKIRQGLSLFMGIPLESCMKPQSIMAAQSIFMPNQPQQSQVQGKPKKDTAKLGDKTNKLYTTPNEASEIRQTMSK